MSNLNVKTLSTFFSNFLVKMMLSQCHVSKLKQTQKKSWKFLTYTPCTHIVKLPSAKKNWLHLINSPGKNYGKKCVWCNGVKIFIMGDPCLNASAFSQYKYLHISLLFIVCIIYLKVSFLGFFSKHMKSIKITRLLQK